MGIFVSSGLKFDIDGETAALVGWLGEPPAGDVSVPSHAVVGGCEYEVTAVRARAFADCPDIVSVTLPASIESVEEDAFVGCASLQSIVVNAGNESYASFDGMLFDASLTTLLLIPGGKEGAARIPDQTVLVPNPAFSRNAHLSTVLVGEGNGAFSSRDGILYSKDLSTLLYAPSGIGEAVVLPPETRTIGEGAFAGAEALRSIVATGPVEDVDPTAFADAVKREAQVALPAGEGFDARKAVWEKAGFQKFEKLAAAGEDPREGEGATKDPEAPEAEDAPEVEDKPQESGKAGFAYTLLEGSTLAVSWQGEGDPEKDLEIPASAELDGVVYPVSVVADRAFEGRSIESVGIPSSVQSIGQGAFSGCSSLSAVSLSEGLKSIGAQAFEGTAIEDAWIPSTVSSVGARAFADCAQLSRIVAHSEPLVDDTALAGCAGVSVYCPANEAGEYPWNMGLVANGNHLLPYGVSLPSEPIELEVGQEADLFEGGSGEEAEGTELSYAYAAASVSVDEGVVKAKAEGAADVAVALSLDGEVLSRASRSVEVVAAAAEADGMEVVEMEPRAAGCKIELDWNDSEGTTRVTSGDTGITATYGAAMSKIPNIPVRVGYTFLGYFSEATGGTQYYNGLGVGVRNWNLNVTSATLYAHWQPITYTIRFHGNGATSGTMEPMNMVYDTEATLTPNAFKRAGYTFQGWTFSEDETTVIYVDGRAVKNQTDPDGSGRDLYAVWKGNPYKVTLDKNGGSGGSDSANATCGSPMPSITVPSWAGYTFDGYWDAKNGGNQYYNASGASVRDWDKATAATLYAHWNGVPYQIRFDGDGATSGSMEPMDMAFGETKNLPECAFKKDGYTFNGWAVAPGQSEGVYAAGQPVTNQTSADDPGRGRTFYAAWKGNPYKVTLDKNGGSGGSDSANATCGSPMPSITVPSWAGYTFDGYWDAKTGGTQYYNASGASVRDWDKATAATLYAHWNGVPYQIRFDGDGATSGSMEPMDMVFGKGKSLPECAFKKDGYTFNGWAVAPGQSEGVYAAGQIVLNQTSADDPGRGRDLYAAWKPNEYAVTLDGNGATAAGTASVNATYGSAMPSITVPSWAGYTFDGYWDAKTGGTQYYNASGASVRDWDKATAATLYAHWNGVPYQIRFHGDGETSGTMEPMDMVFGKGKSLPECAFKKDGYTFNGWAVAPGQSEGVYAAGQIVLNQTSADDPGRGRDLYAAWKPNEYAVTLDGNGATAAGTASVNATYGSAMPPIAALPSRTCYTFDGYWDAKTGGTQYYNASGASVRDWDKAKDATLFAHWAGIPYQIRFDGDGATSGSMEPMDMIYGIAKRLPECAFEKDGYTFNGWAVAPGQSEGVYAAGLDVKNQTSADGSGRDLYAAWKANPYKVTFDSNGGSSVAQQEVDCDATVPQPAAPTWTGYDFKGWYADKELTTPWIFADDTMPPNDMTLYAKWTPHKYNVVFNSKGGTSLDPVSVAYKEKVPAPEPPTQPGYVFSAWFQDAELEQVWDFTQDTMPAKDLVLYAKWEPRRFPVTWGVEDGEAGGTVDPEGASENVDYNANPTAKVKAVPAVPEVGEGYSFVGWKYRYLPAGAEDKPENYVEGTLADYRSMRILGPTSFTAVFKKQPFVSVSAWDGYVSIAEGAEPAPVDKLTTDAVEFDEPLSAGAKQVVISLAPRENFHLSTLTVNDLHGNSKLVYTSIAGSSPSSDFTMNDSALAVESSLDEKGGTLVIGNIMNTLNVNATFVEDGKRTVAFNVQGGSPEPVSQALFTGGYVARPADPERENHTFLGWYKDSACTEGNEWDFDRDTVGDADMVLYARWRSDARIDVAVPIDPEIRIDANGDVTSRRDTVFTSKSNVDVRIAKIDCTEKPGAAELFPDEGVRKALSLTMANRIDDAGSVSMALGGSYSYADGTLPRLAMQAANGDKWPGTLHVDFGLSLPPGTPVVYREGGANVASVAFTFEQDVDEEEGDATEGAS